MRHVAKGTISAIAVVLCLGATGCSTDSSSGDGEQGPADNALSKVDPCSILKPEKASQVGLPPEGKPKDGIESQPGCYYNGSYSGIGIYRIADDTLDEYGKRSVWSEFKRLNVNGRDGAEAHLAGESDDQCLTAISAGGGVVAIQANADDPRKPFDGCAEGLKVAKLIEPDLPE